MYVVMNTTYGRKVAIKTQHHMNRESDKRFWVVAVLCGLLAIIVAFCLSSCSTSHYIRKTDKAVTKLFAKDSVKGVATISKYVPIKAGKVLISTKYVQGKTDTLEVPVVYTVDCDSAIMATLDEAARHHVKCPPCPPSTVRIDTVYQHDSVTVIDPVTEIRLNAAIKQLLPATINAAKWKGRAMYGWGLFIILLLLVAIVEILRLKK